MDLKKTALALLALGLTGVATAGGFMPAPACTNHPVTVPCERSAWDLGFTAFWVRPTSDFTNILGALADDFADTSFRDRSTLMYVKDHKFGFNVEGSYHWATGNDLNLNWTRFHKNEGYTNSIIIPIEEFNTDVRFDALNLELGQQLNVGPNWDLRAHMGVGYARVDIDSTDRTAHSGGTIQTGYYNETLYDSHVEGVGPRAGFDTAYRVSDGFSVVGHSAVSLLGGERRAIVTNSTVLNGVLQTGRNSTHSGNRRSVMLGVDGKVGLAYTSNMSQGSASLEGGYSVATYHNAVDVFGIFSSPFSLDGFYLKAKFVS